MYFPLILKESIVSNMFNYEQVMLEFKKFNSLIN